MAKHKRNGMKKVKGAVRTTTSNGRVWIKDGKEYRSKRDLQSNNYIGKVFIPAEPAEVSAESADETQG